MLNHYLYKLDDRTVLLTMETTYSLTKTSTKYFYSVFKDGTWYNATNPSATKQEISELILNYPQTKNMVDWINKHYLPKAKVS